MCHPRYCAILYIVFVSDVAFIWDVIVCREDMFCFSNRRGPNVLKQCKKHTLKYTHIFSKYVNSISLKPIASKLCSLLQFVLHFESHSSVAYIDVNTSMFICNLLCRFVVCTKHDRLAVLTYIWTNSAYSSRGPELHLSWQYLFEKALDQGLCLLGFKCIIPHRSILQELYKTSSLLFLKYFFTHTL